MNVLLKQRREIKYPFSQEECGAIRTALRMYMRSVRHGDRARSQVHTLYFDTEYLDSYHEKEDGIAQRIKTRLRWYGENPSVCPLYFEFKIKQGVYSGKIRHTVSSIDALYAQPYTHIIKYISTVLPAAQNIYFSKNNVSSAYVTYEREYFVCFHCSARVTLDYNLCYRITREDLKFFPHFLTPIKNFFIVEVKIPKEAESHACIPDFFTDWRAQKNSKYGRVLEHARIV